MRWFLILAATVLLTSCFDIREEVWIHRDGSGRIDFSYTVPREAVLLAGGADEIRTTIRSIAASGEGIHLDAIDIEPASSGTRIAVKARIDSLASLLDLKKSEAMESMPAMAERINGTFDVRISPRGIDFERRIDFAGALGLAALAIPPAERESRRLEYTIHLPTAARTTNADEVLDGGRTLVWRRSLGGALEEPLSIAFDAPLPIPWWAWVLVLLIAAGGILAVARRFRRGRRRA